MRREPCPAREAPDLSRGGLRPAGGRPGFLAFVTDEGSEAALRGGLVDVAGAMQIRRGDVAAATRALEHETAPGTLVVDISGMPKPIVALELLASVCPPDMRVLVVGERSDIGFYRQLTRELCIAEYICKPLTRDTVARLFAPHLLGGGEAESASRGGDIVAVCGVRGGCGATTVAVNLALHLAEAGLGHVALLDLHLRGGTAGLMLGVRPGAGLRVMLEEPERVDALFLERVAIHIDDRVQLIAAEEALESQPHPTEEGVRRLLAMLQGRFNQVVIDLPMPPGPAERIVLAAARHVALVMGPDVAGIRDAIAARKLVGPGASSRVTTVLNRAGMPGTLATKLIEEGLGAPPDVVIPDLPRQLPRAGNLGKPALPDCPALRRALAPLTQEIAAVRSAADGGGTSLFGRIFGGLLAR